ncbi:MAG: hypothetical protein PHF46_02860 [Candidatus Gracilibacteria bacterium]|nr:hypothetical protein [Candidatus Gracilibacteria bacterium]
MLGIIIYTTAIFFIWIIFFVARLHFYKFRNYSKAVIPATKLVALMLTILTVIGYIFAESMFDFSGSSNNSSSIKSSNSTKTTTTNSSKIVSPDEY